MPGTYRPCGGKCKDRQEAFLLQTFFQKSEFPAAKLTGVGDAEKTAAGKELLQSLLNPDSFEQVIGRIDSQLGGICRELRQYPPF